MRELNGCCVLPTTQKGGIHMRMPCLHRFSPHECSQGNQNMGMKANEMWAKTFAGFTVAAMRPTATARSR